MAKSKTVKLKPFQKVLNVLISGKPVTKDEIDARFGSEIQMYRISTYMWHVKTFAGGIVKSIKDGRKVTAYQLMNVEQITKYMNDNRVMLNQTQEQLTDSFIDENAGKPLNSGEKKKDTKKAEKLADISQPVETQVTEPVAE